MKRIPIILYILFASCFSYGQTDIKIDILDKIEIGYSTRWDIEQRFGKGKQLDNYFIDPDYEQDQGEPSMDHANGLEYKDKGITFICAEDGELICSIHLKHPFILKLNEQKIIHIGKTSLGIAFPKIDSLKVNTSGASNYWSFSIDRYRFFIDKPIEHRNKDHYSQVPKFKDNIEYFKLQPISIVTYDFYDSETFSHKGRKFENELYCSRPFYAPKNETHFNCIEMGFPENVPVLLRPIYTMTGGQKSKIIKQGYWKEYGPNHKLIYEGKFKDNKEIGLFKYYDINGNLEKTMTFYESITNWIYLIPILFIAIIWTIRTRKRKVKALHSSSLPKH